MQKLSVYFQNFLLGLILASAGFFLINAAKTDSAIFDETAHIVAGYNYVSNLNYRFNPEHPPLIKMLAGLPLAFENLNFSKDQGYWTGTNEQWWAGNAFLYKSGNDADKIIFSARIGPILITLLLILAVYFLGVEILGRWWAIFPAFLTGFSPIILAHGHYVTTDTGAALGMIIFIYYFLRYALNPVRSNIIPVGLAFGFAQSVKFSSVLLIPYLFFLSLVLLIMNLIQEWPLISPELKVKKVLRQIYFWAISLASIIIIGYAFVVYPLYLYSTWNYPMEKQILDTEYLLQNFSFRPVADAVIWMAGNPVFRPMAEYALGVLMVFQRQAGGNGAFFLGEVSSHGWWYYFPLIYLMKESLPVLLLLFIAGALGLWRILIAMNCAPKEAVARLLNYINLHFADFSLFAFIFLYWASSIASPLNIGVRHILPTVPLFYILSAGSIKKWFAVRPIAIELDIFDKLANFGHSIFNVWIKSLLISFAVIWLVLEAAIVSPNFLSYYNEFFGGRFNGFYYATDSNFDWGQDLKRLKIWTDKNLPETDKIAVDYFGGGDPAYYLGDKFIPWWSAQGNPKDDGINWLAISANTLQGALAKPVADFYKNPADEYRWLENPYGFIDRAGTSIFIYKL